MAKHPEIVREIVADGHTLCNHTWNHSLTIGKDKPAQIQADLARTNAAIRAAVPGAQIPFFRAPGGNFTDRLVERGRRRRDDLALLAGRPAATGTTRPARPTPRTSTG